MHLVCVKPSRYVFHIFNIETNIEDLLRLLQAEQGKEDLIAAADELQLQKAELEKTVAELKQKFEQAERRSAELREAEEKKYTEEIQFLKKTNQQLKVYYCKY